MRPLVNKYLKILFLLTKINLQKELEYRINFWSAILPALFYNLGYLVMVGTVLNKVPTIKGWTFDQMLVLFAVGQLFYYSTWVFYRVSLERLPITIRDGGFDLNVRLPINTRFYTSFKIQAWNVFVPFVATIFILIYAGRNLIFTPFNVIIFLTLFFVGLIILYNVMFIFASLAFWIIESEDLMSTVDDISGFAAYPPSILPTPIAAILLFIFPVILMVYVPATAFLGVLDYRYALLAIVMVFITWFVSQKIWHAGLRHYSSASS